ncbi:MAG: hypothetical protein LBE16_06930 [Clostridiales Family XIII bacterium]|jgi:hypothetical protein|nr:hypothetical protein [Clostridiales Family XIII bacterium]
MKYAHTSKIFIVNLMNDQNETWQGTVTLIDQKATRTTKLPLPICAGMGGADIMSTGKQTIPFRSLLELIHLIDSTLEENKSDARTEVKDAI